jgi:7-cyano-7-deazaguanine synthase in queuosine biosynthesis
MSTAAQIHDQLSGNKLTLDAGRNVSLNLEPFAELGTLDSLDADLLRLAAYVFATDLAIKRSPREQHLRSITLQVPVGNIQAFERVRTSVEKSLMTLSADNWTVEFLPLMGSAPASNRQWPTKLNSTLLFSGGLDSFAGSLHLLKSEPATTLVSHVSHNRPVKTAQSKLAKAVRKFTGKDIKHLQISVFGRNHGGLTFPTDSDREDTQRTRSFLFTALAAIAARLSGSRRVVVMAENGQFAVHLPLSEARIGSFSTHTAHPKFLAQMQELLRQLFACNDLEVTNPFALHTKGEVVGFIPKSLHRYIRDSTSCWRASRMATSHTHCGECVPCLCRRIALETHGVRLPEYQRDLLTENIGALPPDDLGKRNLLDLCQFIMLFGGPYKIPSEQQLCYKFPELLDPHLNTAKVIAMYRRFADEALNILNKYPKIRVLLK